MGAVVEQFIRSSDVQIKLTLTEDGLPISGAWSSLEVWVGDELFIERSADGDGISLSTSTGILIFTPADLTAPEKALFLALTRGQLHPIRIVVFSVLNDDGVVFGGAGSTRILFNVTDRPA